jgi:hypothetical protein
MGISGKAAMLGRHAFSAFAGNFALLVFIHRREAAFRASLALVFG